MKPINTMDVQEEDSLNVKVFGVFNNHEAFKE
jgi:hypothetical protein